jgi:Leucine-rich repeat (LRR) protein
MHENLLSGTIPTEFGLMPEISELRISNNRIYGTIPEQLWDNKTQLLKLDLNDLLLSGTLSSRIGELSSLISIRIRRNRLTGTIPTELALLPNLRLAWLHLNQFTGAIPMCNGPRFLDYLNADCGPDGAPAQECTCCTGCCDRNTELCQLTDDNVSS